MKIEHAALYAANLEEMKAFFEKYFGAVSGPAYHNHTTGFRSYFLTFSEGPRLEIMHRPGLQAADNSSARMGFIHLAFSAGSKERVDLLTCRLKEDGFPVLSGPRTTGDGYYESCILGPENNQIEITV